METSNLISLLDKLDDDIDELEETLAPDERLMAVAYLRLNGTDAKEHAVFRELTRVKQYFQKIQDVEKIGSTRENLSLDKVAAGRMISHVLVSSATTPV
ncbi:MAG: hypothetical protein Q9205_000768 [Flavoplaca limonia]